MSKIVKNKANGQFGLVLIEINEKRWDVVSEDGSWEAFSPEDLVVVGEMDEIGIPPVQREIIASAQIAIATFKTRTARTAATDPFFETLATQVETQGWPEGLDPLSPVGVSLQLLIATRKAAAAKGGQSC